MGATHHAINACIDALNFALAGEWTEDEHGVPREHAEAVLDKLQTERQRRGHDKQESPR